MSDLLRRFIGDSSGNMAIMFAVTMSLTLVAAAFAIDEASLYHERRVAQSAVDLAAIAAARDPDNALTVAREVLVEAGLIDASLSASVLANPASRVRLSVVAGRYQDTLAIAPDDRFNAGAGDTNAVRVWFQGEGTLYFARPWADTPSLTVSALARATPVAAFSVGSRLASLSNGVANAVLNALLGTNVALTALDYNALLSAKVNLFDYLDALAGELGITVGTYDDVLAASADHGDLARAAAALLNGSTRSAAQVLANAAGHNGTLPLAKLFDLGDWGRLSIGSGGDLPTADLAVLEMLVASAAISNGTHQVALNLGASVPGLVGIAMTLAVGEPAQSAAWYGVGEDGKIARTAQLRLRLVTTLGGGAVLLGAQVRVPLYLEIAYAEAKVDDVDCPAEGHRDGSATILARPGVARLTLGDVGNPAFANFGAAPTITTAKLIDVLLLKVTGSGYAAVGAMTPVALHFSASDIANGTIKTARSSGYLTSLTSTLLGSLTLNVSVLGIGLASPATIAAAVKALITPVTPVLDATIATVLEVLGLSLGEADVRVYAARCSQSVLVG